MTPARTLATLGLATLAVLGLAVVLPQAATAQSVFTFNGASPRTNAPSYTLGYSFTTGRAPSLLVGLGYYAPAALKESHEVGLFTQGGTQLADVTVPVGDIGLLGDPFAYAAGYTPENGFLGTLAANTTYVVGGFTGTNVDPFLDYATSITGADGFTYGNSYLSGGYPGATFAAPYNVGNTAPGGYGAPNLEVAAPEPSQTAALGLGVLGLAGLALKARKRTARMI